MTINYYKKDQNHNQAGLFLILGGLAVLTLSGAVLLKYNSIKENNNHNVEITNNTIRIIGDVVKMLGR